MPCRPELTAGEHWCGFVGQYSINDDTCCDVGQCLPTDDSRNAVSLTIKSLRSEKSKLRIKEGGESVRYLVKNRAVGLFKYEIVSNSMFVGPCVIVITEE